MQMTFIYSALTLGGLGMVFGTLLGYASKKFEIEVDPKITSIREVLPGANCGGCGYTGCDAYARAVVEEGAAADACTVGGASVASSIGDILGVKVEAKEKMIAFVKCNGSCDNTKIKADYGGINDCISAEKLWKENPLGCGYGCFGLGSCYEACKFGAIVLENGIARIVEEKCVNCGACMRVCPRNLIEAVPIQKKVRVQCNSKDIGKAVRESCSAGCISCRICEKSCDYDAIHVKDNLAAVDYEKCTQCKACTEKCPTKAVKTI